MANVEAEINALMEDIEMAESELDSGVLDPGETFELKKQIRFMKKKISELEKQKS